VAGAIVRPRPVGKKSLPGVAADALAPVRQSTELVFFDSFDPKPAPPRKFPSEVTIESALQPTYLGPPLPDPVVRSILLPVTTPPTQVPRMVSAGFAFSPYQNAADYSSPHPPHRELWFEFAEPPPHPLDAFL